MFSWNIQLTTPSLSSFSPPKYIEWVRHFAVLPLCGRSPGGVAVPLIANTALEKISCQSHRHTGMVCMENDCSRAGCSTICVPSIKSRRFHGIHANVVPRQCEEVLDHSPVGLLNCGANSSLPGLAAYASRQYRPISLERESSLGDDILFGCATKRQLEEHWMGCSMILVT